MDPDIIIRDTIEGIGEGEVSLHLAHMLCSEGHCRMTYNGSGITLSGGQSAIIRATQLVEKVSPSEDFKVRIVYVSPVFIEKSTPNNNYGMRGSLSLSQDPVIPLTDEEFSRLEEDFRNIGRRLSETSHRFHADMMQCMVQEMILDFYDIHARIHGEAEVPTQNASIMGRFISMLERGDYRENREVSYYASELCIAPKYLSEVSKAVSGNSANWWINRFTILDITRQLRDRTKTFVEISEMFNFSSPAYFSRYVQRYLGESPSEYRG